MFRTKFLLMNRVNHRKSDLNTSFQNFTLYLYAGTLGFKKFKIFVKI